MNFKILIFLLILSGCGVKSSPIMPKGAALPSILAPYLEGVEPGPQLDFEQTELDDQNDDIF